MDKEIVKAMRSAIKNGQLELVKHLLSQNDGLIDVKTVFGTWLHVAAKHGQLETVKYLIGCGMDVNAKGDIFEGNSLRSAASGGDIKIVKLLYEHGAELDVSAPEGNPLFGAIPGGHVGVAKFLIDQGIDLTVHYPVGSVDRMDAYEFACQWGQTEVAEYIKAKLNSQ